MIIRKEDISLSAYEEGYLSANAFYHSHVPLPENPYPPGPWRPFRSWRKGWEDYHIEQEPTQADKFYVGQGGKMPRVGEHVQVTNLLNGTVHQAFVNKTFPQTFEYTILKVKGD